MSYYFFSKLINMSSKKSLKSVESNTKKRSMKNLKKPYNCSDLIILKQNLKLSSQDKHTKRYPPLEGILAKPGYIHKWLSYNQFEPKLTKIPADFKPSLVGNLLLIRPKFCDKTGLPTRVTVGRFFPHTTVRCIPLALGLWMLGLML